MHNLAINYLTEDGSPTILFEPSELIDFQNAWDLQREWQEKLRLEPSYNQAIWMLQHFACYTLGRGASEKKQPKVRKPRAPCMKNGCLMGTNSGNAKEPSKIQ